MQHLIHALAFKNTINSGIVAHAVGIAGLMHTVSESPVMTHEKVHKYVQLVLLLVDRPCTSSNSGQNKK